MPMLGRSWQQRVVWALCLAFSAVVLVSVLQWNRLRMGWYEWCLRSSDPGERTAAAVALLSMKTEAARKSLRDVVGEWVEASVKAVDADEGLLVLSAGREQNVGVGHRGLVLALRGGFRCKFTVIKVYPQLSGARIEPGGRAVEPGDLALVVGNPEPWGLPARDPPALLDGRSNPYQVPRYTEGITKPPLPRAADPDSAGSPRPIRTTVNAVDSGEGLVVLGAGRDDGVEIGYELNVTREDTFVGKIKVVKVYPNHSGAKVIFVREGLAIQRGDAAETRPR